MLCTDSQSPSLLLNWFIDGSPRLCCDNREREKGTAGVMHCTASAWVASTMNVRALRVSFLMRNNITVSHCSPTARLPREIVGTWVTAAVALSLSLSRSLSLSLKISFKAAALSLSFSLSLSLSVANSMSSLLLHLLI